MQVSFLCTSAGSIYPYDIQYGIHRDVTLCTYLPKGMTGLYWEKCDEQNFYWWVEKSLHIEYTWTNFKLFVCKWFWNFRIRQNCSIFNSNYKSRDKGQGLCYTVNCFYLLTRFKFNLAQDKTQSSWQHRQFPLALILTPTRELSLQIFNELQKLANNTTVKSVVLYGGGRGKYRDQINKLKVEFKKNLNSNLNFVGSSRSLYSVGMSHPRRYPGTVDRSSPRRICWIRSVSVKRIQWKQKNCNGTNFETFIFQIFSFGWSWSNIGFYIWTANASNY